MERDSAVMKIQDFTYKNHTYSDTTESNGVICVLVIPSTITTQIFGPQQLTSNEGSEDECSSENTPKRKTIPNIVFNYMLQNCEQ